MIIWVLVILILSFASLLQDFLLFRGLIVLPENIFWATLLDILLLLVALGLLYRMAIRKKVGEKEQLARRVKELEERLEQKGG